MWSEKEMAEKMNKIHCIDCLEFMRNVPDKYFDFVFTDPPYNVGKDYGKYKDNLREDDFDVWISKILHEIMRISKSYCIYTPMKHIRKWWYILEDAKQIVVTFPHSGAIRYGFSNQFISLLTNARPKKPISNHWHNIPLPSMGYFFREDKHGHPGYTSAALTEKAIENLVYKKSKIFDPFAGTGTTLVCSKALGYNFCGCEIEPNYVKIANKRLKKVQTNIYKYI